MLLPLIHFCVSGTSFSQKMPCFPSNLQGIVHILLSSCCCFLLMWTVILTHSAKVSSFECFLGAWILFLPSDFHANILCVFSLFWISVMLKNLASSNSAFLLIKSVQESHSLYLQTAASFVRFRKCIYRYHSLSVWMLSCYHCLSLFLNVY